MVAVFSRPRSQFFTVRTDLKRANNVFKVHLTPKIFFRSIESTRYSKHVGAKNFEFA